MARPRKHPLPSIAELNERFEYRPDTGEIIARLRSGDDPYNRIYNARFAGRALGSTMNVGYWWIRVGDHGTFLGHRVAWALYYGEWPTAEIDHRDGNKTNNRITNLRLATRAQQISNTPSRSRTGFRGVVLDARNGRYYAKIKVGSRTIALGGHATAEQAAEAYAKAARKVYGEFALMPLGSINSTITIVAKAA